jgi:mevalonate kinase
MPAITATAPGKIILLGEHAVVYWRPAIAIPVTQVRARAILTPNPRGKPGTLHIQAPNIGLEADLDELDPNQPLAAAVRLVLQELEIKRSPACTLRITSTIPVASGLGSGASVSVALMRALSAFLGKPLEDERVSSLTFEIEKLHHGTPSGIDNTVITYAKPVFFIKGEPIETLEVAHPFTLLIGDTGIASPTAAAVGDVRRAWQADPMAYERIFDAIGQIARSGRAAIERGQIDSLGLLMDENQELLKRLEVSSPELERLIEAARGAGAAGAKLSGGGRGGNMIALAAAKEAVKVAQALEEAGAKRVIQTEVKQPKYSGQVR